jgi:molybdopterin-guanine dinucleotide biosynthesis protein A
MGTDKARLRLGSRTLLQHVRAAANATGLPVRVIRRDLVPRCGPLGGLYTALKTTKHDAILALACDMPFVTPDLLKLLLKRFGRRKSMFLSHGGKPGFPLLLDRATLPVVTRNIENRRLAIHQLAKSLRSSAIKLRPGAHELSNINTPDELKTAKSWWSESSKV